MAGTDLGRPADLWSAWQLRHRRRYLLARAIRRRRQLRLVQDRTAAIRPGAILLFATLRNEAARLPWFLRHYRQLGVDHFLLVDNASTDTTRALLAGATDVSLWHTDHGYKASRFGMDWLNWLLLRHGHGHWCLTVDADELLIYSHWESRPLPALTAWLDEQGRDSFGALMLDLYPRGRLGAARVAPDTDPTAVLGWFDAGNHVQQRQPRLHNLWIQGGARARQFFADEPARAPTLGKVPLIRWHWRYAYVSSTHTALPRRLNVTYDQDGGELASGILLHTKFMDEIITKSAEEQRRRQHFANSALYDAYYEALIAAPQLWHRHAARYRGWRHLEALGLMSRGGWT